MSLSLRVCLLQRIIQAKNYLSFWMNKSTIQKKIPNIQTETSVYSNVSYRRSHVCPGEFQLFNYFAFSHYTSFRVSLRTSGHHRATLTENPFCFLFSLPARPKNLRYKNILPVSLLILISITTEGTNVVST